MCFAVSRTGKQGYIQVDDKTAQHGHSPGKSVMVNTKGSIYLGMDLFTSHRNLHYITETWIMNLCIILHKNQQ